MVLLKFEVSGRKWCFPYGVVYVLCNVHYYLLWRPRYWAVLVDLFFCNNAPFVSVCRVGRRCPTPFFFAFLCSYMLFLAGQKFLLFCGFFVLKVLAAREKKRGWSIPSVLSRTSFSVHEKCLQYEVYAFAYFKELGLWGWTLRMLLHCTSLVSIASNRTVLFQL